MQIPRIRGGGNFVGLPGHPWQSLHVDELRGDDKKIDINNIRGKSLSRMIEENLVDIDKLIVDAIPKAVSLTTSNKAENSRVEKRLQLLFDKNANELRESVRVNLIKSIEERQAKMHDPDKWLVKMALGNEFLQEGNTFARAIWLHLVSTIAKLMEPIIKVLDYQGGMEHAVTNPNSWKNQLYTYFCRNRDISTLTCEKPNSVLGQFPFSWFLTNLLDRLGQVETQGNLLEAASQNEFVKVVHEITEGNGDALLCYTKDLLGEKAPKLYCEDNQQLVEIVSRKIICNGRKFFLQRVNNDDMSQFNFVTVVDIYLSIAEHLKQIKNLAEIAKLQPVVDKLKDNGEPDFDLDIQAMIFSLDQCKPTIDYLNWKEKVSKLGAIAISMTHPQVKDKWLKISIIEMFMEHVYDQDKQIIKDAVFEKAKLLWMLKDIDFVKSEKTFDTVIKVIKKTSGATAEKLLQIKNPDACLVCKDAFESPVALPCGHVACLDCLNQFKENLHCPAQRNCPALPQGFKIETTKETVKSLKEHQEFRKNLNVFFLNFLQSHVFKVKFL